MIKREKLLLTAVIFLLLYVIGSVLNLQTVAKNNCMMPIYVKNSYSLSMDDKHFTFTNPEEVELFLLTDIIHLPLTNSYSSIGDLLILIGAVGFSVCIIKWGVNIIRKRK